MFTESLYIPEVKLITPNIFKDHRGFFFESYNSETYNNAGIKCRFIQDNQSWSEYKGTVRAMHFQVPPYEQAKLVRVLKGSILDVAFDLRKGSPTFQKYCSAIISAEKNTQIFIPAGFAHGFITLVPNTIVHYKVDKPYSQEHERGFIWNDPYADIDWEQIPEDITISDKDANLPLLSNLPDYFEIGAGGISVDE